MPSWMANNSYSGFAVGALVSSPLANHKTVEREILSMDRVWFVAAIWLLLALVAVLAANWLRISTALSEIVVGSVAQLIIGALAGSNVLNARAEWISFLAGTGAIVLTFPAGAELDPAVFRAKWQESSAVGLVGFFAPFFGASLAGGSRALHNLRRCCLRRDARAWIQSDQIWYGHSRRLLH